MNRAGLMRAARGERGIPWYDRRKIQIAHASGASVAELAERFRLTDSGIRKILKKTA